MQETCKTRDDIRKIRNIQSDQLSGIFDKDVELEELFRALSNLSEVADKMSKSVKNAKTEQGSIQTTENLTVAIFRQISSATRSLWEGLAHKLMRLLGPQHPLLSISFLWNS